MTDIYLRLPQVMKITGLARSTIYEPVKSGEFPQSFLISHRGVAWSQNEVEHWQELKKAARSNQ